MSEPGSAREGFVPRQMSCGAPGAGERQPWVSSESIPVLPLTAMRCGILQP